MSKNLQEYLRLTEGASEKTFTVKDIQKRLDDVGYVYSSISKTFECESVISPRGGVAKESFGELAFLIKFDKLIKKDAEKLSKKIDSFFWF